MFHFKKLFILSLLISSQCFCQSIDSLSVLIKEMQRGKNDSIRFAANDIFLRNFENILKEKGSFSRNFDSLKNVSVQSPNDNKFRIYSWVVPHYDGSTYDYYGFVQLHYDTTDILIRLTDSTDVIQKPESEKLTPERWYGAVYYSIIPITKSGKTYYTLLGWKGKDQRQTQKVIDILYINNKNIKFGYPIIKMGSVFRNRMIFSFNAQISMTLHFDKKYNGIVFDHFSKNVNDATDLNGPDGTYDALKNEKEKWVLYQDVKVGIKMDQIDRLPEPPMKK